MADVGVWLAAEQLEAFWVLSEPTSGMTDLLGQTNDVTIAHRPQISANTAPNYSIQLAIPSTLHSFSSGSRRVNN